MNIVVPAVIVLPLIVAGVSMALWRHVLIQQVVGTVVLAASTALSAVVLVRTLDGPIAVDIGGWAAPIGITLVADRLAAVLLLTSLVTVLAVFLYAIGQPRADKSAFYFHPLYLVLSGGVSAAFLTGDLFNLFVAFELMLSASYVLITLGGSRSQVRSGMSYVVINLVASTLLITAIGLVYAATGTVNMAEAAVRLQDVPAGVREALGALLLVTFGIKAAIFPLYFWLPDSYPTAPAPVTAVFAGLLTKIGVYAIIRTQLLLFPSDGGPDVVLLVLAGATMVIGVLGAIAQDDIKRILSFHIVSQIGYMLFGLGLSTELGVAAAIFYVIHQIPVKTALFLVNGMIESVAGTGALHSLGGLLRRSPLIAVLFLLSAASLAGIPPFSGFFGKVALVNAGFSTQAWAITAVSLVVSVFTLISMTKIWAGAFWGDAPVQAVGASWTLARPPWLMSAATVGLVLVTLGIAIFAEPIWQVCADAAAELLDPQRYVEAVLGR